MTDAPTPEIRKLADTIVQRYLAHPDGSFYAELMAQIEPLIASAIAQAVQDERASLTTDAKRLPEYWSRPASCGIPGHFWFQMNGNSCLMCQERGVAITNALQDERAKRGALIERAARAACPWCRLGAMFETKYETHRVASAEVSDPRVFTVEWCDAKDVYALDPEATQAFDAVRERIANELLVEICKATNAGLRDSEGNPYSNEELKSKAISTSRAGWRELQRVRERERKLRELAATWREPVEHMKNLSSEPKWKDGEFESYRVLQKCADELEAVLAE